MNLTTDPELEAFRAEVRGFIASHLPLDLAERVRRTGGSDARDGLAWAAILARKGWSVPHWPVEYGGTGWDALRMFVFEDECYRANAPIPPWMGDHMVAPVIFTFGSQEQKDRFLGPIRDGETLWAQGFSEPGSGSDLASLRTRAVRDGDHYVVNGQKIWTSGAYEADWGFFLVRTDTECKPQLGISFLLVDLRNTPGITIRRIPQMNGDAHVCEVFLDNVKVPAANLVGEPGAGWSYAKFLLDRERTASSFIYWNKRELDRCKAIARSERDGDTALIDTPHYRDRIARLEAEVMALEWSVLRVLADEPFRHNLTAVSSALKVRGSQLQQSLTELQIDLMGRRALRRFDFDTVDAGTVSADEALWPGYVPGRTNSYLVSRAATVYGGALQVQKNIIAKLAFGL